MLHRRAHTHARTHTHIHTHAPTPTDMYSSSDDYWDARCAHSFIRQERTAAMQLEVRSHTHDHARARTHRHARTHARTHTHAQAMQLDVRCSACECAPAPFGIPALSLRTAQCVRACVRTRGWVCVRGHARACVHSCMRWCAHRLGPRRTATLYRICCVARTASASHHATSSVASAAVAQVDALHSQSRTMRTTVRTDRPLPLAKPS